MIKSKILSNKQHLTQEARQKPPPSPDDVASARTPVTIFNFFLFSKLKSLMLWKTLMNDECPYVTPSNYNVMKSQTFLY